MMRSRPALLRLAGLVVGSVLVLVSGHGGNSTGGSELVWQIGGIVVYASLAGLVVAAGASLVVLVWAGLIKLRDQASRLT